MSVGKLKENLLGNKNEKKMTMSNCRDDISRTGTRKIQLCRIFEKFISEELLLADLIG